MNKPNFLKSTKLSDVCYDIRGPVLKEANRLEEEGHRIMKLNVGNPAPFGFDAPDEILQDVIRQLPLAQGYCESKGLYSARKAVMQHYQGKGLLNLDIDDIYLGNGVSELISLVTQALLNNGDEVLIPSPDYPLWTATVSLAGGKPRHYRCDEQADWQPDLDDIRSKITDKTKAIVIINPNNPTGSVYSQAMLEALVNIAEEHGLIILADEIYDKILYDDAVHIPLSTLVNDTLCVTFNGLSKAYRLAGFRSGWITLTGAKHRATDFITGLEMLSSMRLCANVPAQLAIQTCLGGHQSIDDLVRPGGRLYEQRKVAHELLTQIPGISCYKPMGAIYMFPKIDSKRYPIANDEKFVLDLLIQEKILLVQGTAFNLDSTDHLRIVFLPRVDDLRDAAERIERFLSRL